MEREAVTLADKLAELRSSIASMPQIEKAEVRTGSAGAFVMAVERAYGPLIHDPKMSGFSQFCGVEVVEYPYLPLHMAVLMVNGQIKAILDLSTSPLSQGGQT